MSKVALSVLFVASFLLAGCAGGDATSKAGPGVSAPLTADPALVTADLGAIRGTVMDEEQAPVVGATIGIRGAGNASNTISSQDGKFSFSHLEPGQWEVIVGAAFFEGAVKRVSVAAGEITDANIAIKRVPDQNNTELYVVQDQKRGLINAAYSFPWTSGAILSGSVGQGVFLNEASKFPLEYDAALGLREVVLELVWQPAAIATGTALQLNICSEETVKDSQNNCFNVPDSPAWSNRTEGPSPLVLRESQLPLAEIQDYVIAVGDGGGPGVTAQQNFDLYISICYGVKCPADYQMRPPS